MTDLTDQQRAFVDALLADPERHAAAAAQRAGLRPRQAPSLMRDPAIQAEIERRQQAQHDATMADLAAIGATGDRALMIAQADDAYRAAERTANITGMVAATKLKADLLGVLDTPPEVKQSVRAEDLTDDDLAAIVATCKCGVLKGKPGAV